MKTPSIDLHGQPHYAVKNDVIRFIESNWDSGKVIHIITGNSHNMRKIVIIILLALSIIFILQNIQTVTVSFLTISISMPRALLLTITLVFGIIIGLIIPKNILK